MLTQSTRPKCKADTYYVPMSDGVYLRGNNNRLVLKGKSLYPLLEHLIPNLDGNVTLAELTGGLDADKKRMVTNLIEKLFAHQFLKDTSQDQIHTLRPLELAMYAPDIAFIESFQTSAAYRFECFRNKHLLIIGSGSVFPALVQASLQSGVRKTDALATLEDESAASLDQDMPDLFARDASEQRARLLDPPVWNDEAEVRKMLQGYDAILHITDRPLLARTQLLNRLCIEQQKTFMQATIVDDHAWLGPLVSPETASCWECAWRRLQANVATSPERLARYGFCDQPLASGSRFLGTAEALMIANRLIFGLFHSFTQISPPETAAQLSSLDLETYIGESHPFAPHPHCLACQHSVAPTASQFLEQVQQLQSQPPTDPDSLLKKVAGCVDEKLGLFTALDTSNFVQAPLAVYRARLSNPMLKEFQQELFSVPDVGTDTRDAVTRTAQRACERYAANFVDQRRLLSSEAAHQANCPVIPSAQLFGVEPILIKEALWTWALDLRTQQAVLVDASQAFSTPREQGRGVGSGQTWEEALCQALLDWCNDLTVKQIQDAQQVYPQVDLTRTSLTPEGLHLSQLLKATTRPITIYDVTGSLQVPTFATCLDEQVIAYSTHCTETQALRLGLEQALRVYQAEQFQQADYAVAPVPDLPKKLRGEHLSVPCSPLPDSWPARLAWLLQQLQEHGLHACVVPLNHDPALAQALPFIVRVLLRKRELKEGE